MLRSIVRALSGTFVVATLASQAVALPQCPSPAPPQALLPSGSAAADGFGAAISVRGDVALIGAPWASPDGAAYVFRRQPSGLWVEEAAIPSPVPGVEFGAAVGIDGDRAIIGAPQRDYPEAPAVFLFERFGGVWTQVASFVGDSFLDFEQGYAVAIDGDRAVFGNPSRPTGPTTFSGGEAWTLERVGGTWQLDQQLTSPLAAVPRRFGAAVTIRDGVLAIGAPNLFMDPELPNGGQEVYVYELDANGDWVQQAWFVDAPFVSYFGYAVSTDGVRIAVGAPLDDDVSVIARNGSGTWIQESIVAPLPDLQEGQLAFGASVSLEDDALAVGGGWGGGDPQAFLYEDVGGAWELRSTYRNLSPGANARFGVGIALFAGRLMVGAPWFEWDTEAGSVGVFDRCTFWSACAGDGSGAACPCGNSGAPGHGCASSASTDGARLWAFGWPGVGADEARLRVESSTPGQPGLFFQGDALLGGGAGLPFGDGLRCVGGGVVRLEIASANGAGVATSTIPLAATGGLLPGDTAVYQWWYRDPSGSPCNANFNLSNAIGGTWQP